MDELIINIEFGNAWRGYTIGKILDTLSEYIDIHKVIYDGDYILTIYYTLMNF